MNRTKLPHTLTLLSIATALPFAPLGADGESPAPTASLDETVITAGKFPQKPEQVGSALSVIDAETMVSQRQMRSLEQALTLTPGVALTSNGVRGSQSSVFLRGVNPNQTQYLVDGIRVSNANVFADPFFGGERLFNTASVEILRGPQSALYGGEAIGGVISSFTRRGTGAPAYSTFVEYGTFGSLQSALSGQGSSGDSAYSFSFGQEHTENGRPRNGFRQWDSSLRLDHALSDTTSIGMTFRHATRRYESPGSIFANDPDDIDRDTSLLGTVFLDTRIGDNFESRLTLGGLVQELEFETPPTISHIGSRMATADWRNIIRAGQNHTFVAGVNAENTWSKNTGFGSIHDSEFLLGVYLQDTVQVTEQLTVTGGGRWENYESFGDVVTWRGTASYEIAPTASRLHGSIGSGFRAPSFFELYASDPSFVGNPHLDPEESIGWDAGIEQQIGDALTVDVTYFQNRLRDLIVTEFADVSTVANVDRARTRGVELGLTADINDRVRLLAQYTYLDAENRTTGEDLVRRPDHTFAIDLNADITDRILLGVGVTRVGSRSDIHADTFDTITGGEYTLWRAYARAEMTENIHATLRVENASDEDYDKIHGFPGRGFGVFGGITVNF